MPGKEIDPSRHIFHPVPVVDSLPVRKQLTPAEELDELIMNGPPNGFENPAPDFDNEEAFDRFGNPIRLVTLRVESKSPAPKPGRTSRFNKRRTISGGVAVLGCAAAAQLIFNPLQRLDISDPDTCITSNIGFGDDVPVNEVELCITAVNRDSEGGVNASIELKLHTDGTPINTFGDLMAYAAPGKDFGDENVNTPIAASAAQIEYVLSKVPGGTELCQQDLTAVRSRILENADHFAHGGNGAVTEDQISNASDILLVSQTDVTGNNNNEVRVITCQN